MNMKNFTVNTHEGQLSLCSAGFCTYIPVSDKEIRVVVVPRNHNDTKGQRCQDIEVHRGPIVVGRAPLGSDNTIGPGKYTPYIFEGGTHTTLYLEKHQ